VPRRYPRINVQLHKFEVEVGPLGARATRGVVLDISRGGMKVKLESEIPEMYLEGDYLIRFTGASGQVSPEIVIGRVRRSEGNRQYAIEFRKPLEALEIEREDLEAVVTAD
jgi:c-di-GMP-binding flagellar brake protein YcgR